MAIEVSVTDPGKQEVQREEPKNPEVAPSPPPKAAAPGNIGPGADNNFGQQVHHSDVAKPADYDHTRPPDEVGRLGYLRDGRPWSPYGVTDGGKIRKRPVQARGKDPAPAGVQEPGAHRLASGDQKPPVELIGLYSACDDAHRRLNDVVREIRRRHPESKYAEVPHPKAIGRGGLVKADPTHGPSTIADLMESATDFLSRKLDDEEAKPKPGTIKEAAGKVSEASKYYGINTDPKTTATWAAVVAVAAVFLPAILAGLEKLLARIFDDKEEKPKALPPKKEEKGEAA